MKNKIIKALLLTFSILLIIGVILYLFPFIINLSTHEGQLAFKNEIDNLGVWGIIVLFMLQLLQIVLKFKKLKTANYLKILKKQKC